jgi:hypothetical protein
LDGRFAHTGGVLRAEPVWVEFFTGLGDARFEQLVRAVRARGGDEPRTGRPWCLPLSDRVLLVAVYYRTNLTMRQLAPLFGVSSATVCRVVQRLGPFLALERAARPVEGVERLRMEGTLAPVPDRIVAASPGKDPHLADVRVVIRQDTRLAVASARPAPGNKANGHVWQASDRPAQCQGSLCSATTPDSTTDWSFHPPDLREGHYSGPGRKPTPGTGAPASSPLRPDADLQDPLRPTGESTEPEGHL